MLILTNEVSIVTFVLQICCQIISPNLNSMILVEMGTEQILSGAALGITDKMEARSLALNSLVLSLLYGPTLTSIRV